jgi:hypothetical protein
MTTNNFCFYLQNRLIQTSQTGGQQYSDTSPLSIPCFDTLKLVKSADWKLLPCGRAKIQPGPNCITPFWSHDTQHNDTQNNDTQQR